MGAEQAIACFEHDSGLPVVVHDLENSFWNQLAIERFQHRQPFCQAVKAKFDSRCRPFEIEDFRREAARWPNGRLHRCHAGVIELVLPVFDQGRLVLVLFAGPARIDDHGALDLDALHSPLGSDRQLPLIQAERLPWIRERLLQLGARLRCLATDAAATPEATPLPRRTQIERFIERHHSEPLRLGDLAHELGLGIDRCRHVVSEQCGKNFATLLKEARLRAASAMLLNSDQPVADIGERCGLPDPSGFSRSFQAMMGTSPGRWRRQHQA